MANKNLGLDRPGSSNNAYKRIAPLYSDSIIILGIWQSEEWKNLFLNGRKVILNAVVELLKFWREASILIWRIWFRYSPGRKTTGWIVFMVALGMLIGCNNLYLLPPFAPLGLFFFGGIAAFGGVDAAYNFAFTTTRSEAMEIFIIAFALRGLIQLIGMQWLGWRNDVDSTKRGHSFLLMFAGKKAARWEPFVQRIIEPFLCFAATFWMYRSGVDVIVVGFFGFAAAMFVWQELLDYFYQKKNGWKAGS